MNSTTPSVAPVRTVGQSSQIKLYDNPFEQEEWEYIWKVGERPRWQFGHVSSKESGIPFWAMNLNEDQFFTVTLFLKIRALLREDVSIERVYANGATYGQPGGRHVDSSAPGALTFLIYANPTWEPSWGGRTVFLPPDGECSILPKPKTAVCFPANVPHFADDLSRTFTGLRTTVAYKLARR